MHYKTLKSHEELVEKYLNEFYLFIGFGLEKRLQFLSDKFSMLKASKSDDEKAEYFGEIWKFFESGKGKQGVEKAFRVNARIKKRVFKNEVYLWELKIIAINEIPIANITQEIWDREMSFLERLKITPEIREGIELLKSKKLDPANLAQKPEKENNEPEVSNNIFKKLARSGTNKFKLQQEKTLKPKTNMLLSGALTSVDDGESSQRSIKPLKDQATAENKLDKKQSLSPEPEKKPTFGGLKLLAKGLGVTPAPTTSEKNNEKGSEKEVKPLFGKIGKTLFSKKSSKIEETMGKTADLTASKDEGGKNTLFKERLNQLKIQNLSKDNKQEQREQLALQLRIF